MQMCLYAFSALFPHTGSILDFVLFIMIEVMLPVQDGLQVQDDLSLMVVAAGLPRFFFLHSHEVPWRHGDLSTRHHPPSAELHAQRATHAC